MVTSTRTNTVHSCDPVLDTRADHVRRRTTYGSRAYASIQRQPFHAPSRSNPDKCSYNWFGSDGLKAGFTTSNVAAVLGNRSFRRQATSYAHGFYTARLLNINILQTCQLLAKMGCASDTFYPLGLPPSRREYGRCSPAQVAKQGLWYSGYGWLDAATGPASKMGPIEFVGGPPSRWGLQRGSLFSLLLDRLLVLVLLEGASAASRLQLKSFIQGLDKSPKSDIL